MSTAYNLQQTIAIVATAIVYFSDRTLAIFSILTSNTKAKNGNAIFSF
jgi:hypothetical protein